MYPDKFEYFAPDSISKLEQLLDKYKDDSKIMAGGHSLIPLLKLRLTSIPYIIDISNIKDLNFVEYNDNLEIGPMTRTAEVASNKIIRDKCKLLSDAASKVADPQVRNMGTVGGDICEADPRNDMPAVMLALNAEFEVTNSKGSRIIKAEDFFEDAYTTALESNDILTKIIIKNTENYYGKYYKYTTLSSDFAVFAIAINMSLNGDKTVKDIGIGLTNLNNTAVKAKDAEDYLKNKRIDDKTCNDAFNLLLKSCDIEDDINGKKEDKEKILKDIFVNGLKGIYKVF